MSMTADQMKMVAEPMFQSCDEDKDGFHNKEEARNFFTQMSKMQNPDATEMTEEQEAKFNEGFDKIATDGKVSFEVVFDTMCTRMRAAGKMEA